MKAKEKTQKASKPSSYIQKNRETGDTKSPPQSRWMSGSWFIECIQQYHLKSYDNFDSLIALKMALQSATICCWTLCSHPKGNDHVDWIPTIFTAQFLLYSWKESRKQSNVKDSHPDTANIIVFPSSVTQKRHDNKIS